MNDAELDRLLIRLRIDGRLMRLGLNLRPAVLPRSRRIRKALEAEADNDVRVRTALDVALKAEQTKPGKIIRRHVNADIRIY